MPAEEPDLSVEAAAIWDTGATTSVISQDIVDRLELKPTGTTKAVSIHGAVVSPTYLVRISLGPAASPPIQVTVGNLGEHDVLIGMDIIGAGDFALTHPNDMTQFTFRVPPQANIDFVREAHAGAFRERVRGLLQAGAVGAVLSLAVGFAAAWIWRLAS